MSKAQLIGSVPEQFRETFSQPLPAWTVCKSNPVLKIFTDRYLSDEKLRTGQGTGRLAGKLDEQYAELFATVAELGHVSCHRNTYIQIDLVQGAASEVGKALGWHNDHTLHYRRLVACDVFGTLYGTPGNPLITPDYGVLSFDDQAPHRPNLGPEDVIKTRLQVTLMPEAGNGI